MSKVKKEEIYLWIKPFLTIMVVSIFMPLFIYTNNADEATFIEIIPIMLLFTLGSLIVFGLFYLFLRKIYLSAIASILLTLIFCNYVLIETLISFIFPALKIWHTLPILFVIVLHIIYFTNKKLSINIQTTIVEVFGIVFSCLIIFNVVMAVPAIITKISVVTQKKEEISTQEMVTDKVIPNVYYLLFDEYSNFDMIEKYYDYDNYHFAKFLEEKGFAVSYDTVNESSSSNTLITNFVNYNYVVSDNSSVTLKTALSKNNEMIKLFTKYDYDIVGIGKTSFLGIESVIENSGSTSAVTVGGINTQELILQQTAIGLFFIKDSMQERKLVLDTFNWFDDINNLNLSNRFIVKYSLLPHQPFLFNKNGGMVNVNNRENWEDKSYYLEQYIFTTKKMQEIIENIITNDPDCVIVLQADHGQRFLDGTERIDMQKPLNAVYFRGEDISEIKGQTSVNTWRLVINRLFAMELEILEIPSMEVNN